MRRGSLLTGIRSAFSRAARRAWSFFGWHAPEDEGDAVAVAMLLGQGMPLQAEDTDNGGGSGSAPLRWDVSGEEETLRPDDGAACDGFDEVGEPINYADDSIVDLIVRRKRARELLEDDGAAEGSEAEGERARAAEEERAYAEVQELRTRQNRQRIAIANAKAAKARRAREVEEKAARTWMASEWQDGFVEEFEQSQERDGGPELT